MKHMSSHHSRELSRVLLALTCACVAGACDNDDGGADAAAQLQWYQTCGDPACGGYAPTPGATLCTTEMEGASCSERDARCEIANDDCNTDLQCTDSDPATMCPISRRRFKRDIRYLDSAQRDALVRQLLDTRLATYQYRSEAGATRPHLGFLIDDQPHSPAVLPSGERVDLYGYTSMAVAAIQAQAEQIQRLEAEIARLQRALDMPREQAQAQR